MNTGVGSLSLLQGIFPTQGLNPGFSHCRWIRYQLSHQGRPFPGGSDGSVYLQCGGGRREKEMATHSSTLAWKIPWTEEPGGLQSVGLQRVGHNY